jgi:hypothetical protein
MQLKLGATLAGTLIAEKLLTRKGGGNPPGPPDQALK